MNESMALMLFARRVKAISLGKAQPPQRRQRPRNLAIRDFTAQARGQAPPELRSVRLLAGGQDLFDHFSFKAAQTGGKTNGGGGESRRRIHDPKLRTLFAILSSGAPQ